MVNLLRRNKIKIAGKKVKIVAMPAKEGLESVVELSTVIHDMMPYLVLLADRSRAVRVSATVKLIKDTENLPDVLLSIVSKSTTISIHELEKYATVTEIIDALTLIVKVNDWDRLWAAALNLRIVNRQTMFEFVAARIQDIRAG